MHEEELHTEMIPNVALVRRQHGRWDASPFSQVAN